MMKRWGCVALVLAVAVLGGCRGQDGRDASADEPRFDAAFLMNNEVWREQRREALLAPDGWTSLVGLHWLTLKAHYIGSGSTSGIRLAMGPPRLGLVSREGDRFWFTPEPGVEVQVDGEPVKGRIPFRSDDDAEPTLITFDEGKGVLGVIHRGPRFALRLRHAEAPARTGFGELEYWPADPGWRISARFLPHDAGKTLSIVDITGTASDQPNAGAIEFERDGRTWRLEALGEPGRPLFVVFADRTSGRGSYAAGRYIDVDVPDDKGRVVIDFNRAYSPPCAFTPFATCPLPPPENRLDMPVEAGEKAYLKPEAGDAA